MRLSLIAICLFISTLAALAQGDRGSITGVVTDQVALSFPAHTFKLKT